MANDIFNCLMVGLTYITCIVIVKKFNLDSWLVCKICVDKMRRKFKKYYKQLYKLHLDYHKKFIDEFERGIIDLNHDYSKLDEGIDNYIESVESFLEQFASMCSKRKVNELIKLKGKADFLRDYTIHIQTI